ncbi:MAG: hypothetical protein U0792_05695 [Gemmataceae bacterium]
MNLRVGDVGQAVTALSPSGYVEIEGVRRSAKSESTYIEAGTTVVVVRGEMPSFIVRQIEPGTTLTLPNHGEEIAKPEAHRNAADVTAVECEEQRLAWQSLQRRMKIGAAAAGGFGLLIGIMNAELAYRFNWAGSHVAVNSSLMLFSAVGCMAWAVMLYFATGFLAPRLLPYEDRGFAADFFGVAAGLVGGLLGFWVRFQADGITLVGWSVGVSVAFAALACAISWLVGLAAA